MKLERPSLAPLSTLRLHERQAWFGLFHPAFDYEGMAQWKIENAAALGRRTLPLPSALRRLFTHIFGAFLALSIASSVHAADKPPAKPRVQPLRSVTVRLMPAGSVDGPWKITTNAARSCSVQVDAPENMAPAFAACMSAKPEREGCQTVRYNAGKDRLRVVILPNGSWDRTGCDQSKVKAGAK